VADLDAPVLASHYDSTSPATDHNLFIRGNLVYEANYRSGLRVLDASEVLQGVLREVGFFDVYPADDAAEYNGAWSAYPFFASGSVAVNGIEQGLFVLTPRVRPRLPTTGLTASLSGPVTASLDEDWIYVVRVANDGPRGLTDTRVMEQPPTGARVLSARPSQGQCTTGGVVSCDLGNLAAGAEAFVTVTIRTDGERDFISTAIATARGSDGTNLESSARTTTRGLRPAEALMLHRPGAATTFRTGRNNTVQWTMRGVTGGVSVELSRDDGRTWETLSEDAENVGFHEWTGVGAAATRARVRVTSVARPKLTRTSPAFTIR
jgi:hypothetical protein